MYNGEFTIIYIDRKIFLEYYYDFLDRARTFCVFLSIVLAIKKCL